MQYKYIIGYLRLSQDDEDATDESNSIKNQRLLIQQFIQGNKEFEGAKNVFFTDDGYSGTNFNRPDFKDAGNGKESRFLLYYSKRSVETGQGYY